MAADEVTKPSSLPPYPQMILRAIEALDEENGSNKTSISKYMESTYGELPTDHSNLLSRHLNAMKESGQLVFWKNNYTKYDPNAPPRRGRGRPPKPKPKDPLPPDTVLGPPRPRGRPPKDPSAPPKPPRFKLSAGSGRPRGRPRKMARPAGGLSAMPVAEGMASSGRPRGRPPKAKGALTEVSVEQ